jgi:hypothetical protein
MAMSPSRLRTALAILATLGSTSSTWAVSIVNGDFETRDLSGWQVSRTVAMATTGSPISPLQGGASALIVDTNGGAGCLLASDTWNCLPPPIPFEPAGGPALTYGTHGDYQAAFYRGSYIAQDLIVSVGQVLTFDYRFMHPDVDGVRFLAVNDQGATMLNVMGWYGGAAMTEDVRSFNFAFDQAGKWTIYIGTYQTEDPTIYSLLEVDNVMLQSIPWPGTAPLLLAGLLGLWVASRLRRKGRDAAPITSTLPRNGEGAISMRADAVGVRRGPGAPPTAIQFSAAIATALVLSACNKAPSEPPAPTITPAPSASTAAGSRPADGSVPDAASSLTGPVASEADRSAGRSNSAMSRAQESAAMPMPGQTNDHSAPLTPATRASGP